MMKVELYSQSNSLVKAAAVQCLEEYASKLNWMQSGETIIDLGCGDGDVTCLLKKYIRHYDKFVACDISENIIEYAKEHHGHENITFRVFDIVGDIPDDLRCAFSHVFSFLVLHWIRDQEKAYKNIYDLMSPGGECLTTFAGNNYITYLYDVIARNTDMVWGSSWIKDTKKFVSQFVHMQNIEKYMHEMLRKIGYVNIDVQCKKTVHNFDNIDVLKNFVESVDPYGMPDAIFENFFRDFMFVGEDMNIFDKLRTDGDKIKIVYDLFIVHARKPN